MLCTKRKYNCWIPPFTLKHKIIPQLIFGWGYSSTGEIGDGGTNSVNSNPLKTFMSGVLKDKKIAQIDAGFTNSGVLSTDGLVYIWASNVYGQLGNGTTGPPDALFPTGPVTGLTSVTNISLGNFYVLAVNNDGTIKSWGLNDSGQLGNGTIGYSSTPVSVIGVTGAIQVAGGSGFSLALLSNGDVMSWGRNTVGQLGIGNTGADQLTATMVIGGHTFEKISISNSTSAGIISSTGEVWTWGDGQSGQLGNGSTGVNNPTPVQVVGIGGTGYINNVTNISVGSDFMVALKFDGTVWAWGGNNFGQLGSGSLGVKSTSPVQVAGLPSNIISVKAGYSHAIALTSDGKVYSWGNGSGGAMGDGVSSISNIIPILVNDLGYPFGNKIKQISGGYLYTLALS